MKPWLIMNKKLLPAKYLVGISFKKSILKMTDRNSATSPVEVLGGQHPLALFNAYKRLKSPQTFVLTFLQVFFFTIYFLSILQPEVYQHLLRFREEQYQFPRGGPWNKASFFYFVYIFASRTSISISASSSSVFDSSGTGIPHLAPSSAPRTSRGSFSLDCTWRT